MNLAELGPFFAVHTHDAGAVPVSPWRRLSELLDIAPSGDTLRHRVTAIRGYLAAGGGQVPDGIPLRVAASVTQLGLMARLVSPVLGSAVLAGRLVDVDPDSAWWQPELGGTFPLSLPPPGDPPADLVAGLVAVLNGPIRALVDATRRFSVSDRILWGNVASSVNGAVTAIAAVRPDLAGRADELVSALLDQEPLRDSGVRTSGKFRRNSCCLIYRAAPDGQQRAVCGDCVLAR